MADTLIFFLMVIVMSLVCGAGAVLGVRILRALVPTAPPRIQRRSTPPPTTIEASSDDFVPDEEVECIGDVEPRSESVKAKVGSDGTVSLLVPVARTATGTTHEKPAATVAEPGTAYEVHCRVRRCRFRWRLPGLHKKPPKNFRCPACKGYRFTTKPVFHVTRSGRVKIVKRS